MAGLMALAERMVINSLLSDDFPSTKSNGIGQGIIALFSTFMLIGIGFMMYGAHIWFSKNFAPEIAAALTGVVSMLVAGLIAGITYAFVQYRIRKFRHMKRTVVQKLQAQLSSFDDEFGDIVRQNPKLAMMAATLGGFVLEDKIRPGRS